MMKSKIKISRGGYRFNSWFISGTASLLTLLLKLEEPSLPLSCYAYGGPLLVTEEVATSKLAIAHIKNFVLNHDVVPRASIGTVNALRRDAEELVYNIMVSHFASIFFSTGRKSLQISIALLIPSTGTFFTSFKARGEVI
jgi:hypothetical protein